MPACMYAPCMSPVNPVSPVSPVSSASVGQFLSYFVTNERSDGQGDWIRVPSKSACHWTVKTYGVTSFSEYILSEY